MEPQIQTHSPAPNQPTRKSRLRRVLIIGIAIGFGAIILALLLGVGIPIVRECTRHLEPLKFEYVASGLLSRDDSPAVVTAGLTSTPRLSSSAPATSSTSTLCFKPFIPEAPDFSAEFRRLRPTLNLRFDCLLGDIEAYERAKTGLSYEKAKPWLKRIEKEGTALWDTIVKSGQLDWSSNMSKSYTGAVVRRHDEYLRWDLEAELELNAKSQKWNEAALWSIRILSKKRMDWELQCYLNAPNQPIFPSHYFRQNGFQDWDRMIACYRQAGGWRGYGHIALAVLGRQKERFLDTL